MNYAHFFIYSALRSKASLRISLCLTCLLLLFDRGNLYHARSNSHSRCNRCHDITDHRNSRCRTISRDRVLRRLRHRLNNLHGKQLFVRLVLRFGKGGLFLLFKFRHLVVVTFCRRNLRRIAGIDGGCFLLEFRLDERRNATEYLSHATHDSGERLRNGLPGIALQPISQFFIGFLHAVLSHAYTINGILFTQS